MEKSPHHHISLGPWTPVFLDCPLQIPGPTVMKEEDTLPESPEGRGPKLSRRGLALTNPVGESVPHVVKRKVGVQICGLSAESCDSGSAGLKRWRVAYGAANLDKELVAVGNRSGTARRILRGRRRRKKAHE